MTIPGLDMIDGLVSILFGGDTDYTQVAAVDAVNGDALLVLPVTVTEAREIRFGNTITEHAIEDGSNIADHITPTPVFISLTIRVTDTPVSFLAGLDNVISGATNLVSNPGAALQNFAETGSFSTLEKPSQKAFNALKRLAELRTPVTVVGRHWRVANMAVESIDQIDDDTESIAARISFKSLRIVERKTASIPNRVVAPAVKDKAAPKADVKTAAKAASAAKPKPADAAAVGATKSWLLQAGEAFGLISTGGR